MATRRPSTPARRGASCPVGRRRPRPRRSTAFPCGGWRRSGWVSLLVRSTISTPPAESSERTTRSAMAAASSRIVGDPDGGDARRRAGPPRPLRRGGRAARGRARSAARRGAAPSAPARASGPARRAWPRRRQIGHAPMPNPARPTRSSSSATRRPTCRRGHAAPSAARSAMLAPTSRCGKSCSSWNTIPTRRRCVGSVGDVGAVDGDGPAVGHEEAGDHPQQRALAAPGRTEQGDDLAVGDRDRHASSTVVPSNATVTSRDLEHARPCLVGAPVAAEVPATSTASTIAIVAAARIAASA